MAQCGDNEVICWFLITKVTVAFTTTAVYQDDCHHTVQACGCDDLLANLGVDVLIQAAHIGYECNYMSF